MLVERDVACEGEPVKASIVDLPERAPANQNAELTGRQLKTLKFAARCDKPTMDALWEEARKANRHYNAIIAAENDRRKRRLRMPASEQRDRLGKHLRRLAALKKARRAWENQQANKKVKLPKSWVERYNTAVKSAEAKRDALPLDPEYERVMGEVKLVGAARGSAARLSDEAQATHDKRVLECASQHPTVMNWKKLEIEKRETSKRLRAESGLHHSTYLLTEEAANQAIQSKRYGTVVFRAMRLRGAHRVGIGHVANNSKHEAYSELLSPLDQKVRGDISVQVWGTHQLKFFFGAKKDGREYTAVIKQHREGAKLEQHRIPAGAEVHTAWLQLVKRKGSQWDLELCMTIKMPISDAKNGSKTLGIDTGFRYIDGGEDEAIRVASLSDGRHIDTPKGQSAKTRSYFERVTQAEALRGTADQMTLDFWQHYYGPIPQHAGRSWAVRRLHREIMRGAYVRERISSREASLRWKAGERSFELYRLQHKHLADWAASLDEKARRSRKHHVRAVAAEVAQDYDVIAVEALKLNNMARSQIAGGNRAKASPSEFRGALKEAAKTYGARYCEVPAANTSLRCAVCGEIHPDARDGVDFTCRNPRCANYGVPVHADTNAALNIKALAADASGAAAPEVAQALAL